MSKQHRLSEEEIENAKKAHDAILKIGSWQCTKPGEGFWVQARGYLRSMILNGTSDGNPPEEPSLTDSDACNRIPVMARDHDRDSWKGPFVLLSMTDEHLGCCVRNDEGYRIGYRAVRRLTSSEMTEWRARK